MSHASQETVDSDANNAAMPDDRKRGAGAPFAKVDLTRSHGIDWSIIACAMPSPGHRRGSKCKGNGASGASQEKAQEENHCQSARNFTLWMASLPNTNCMGVARVVVCAVARIAKPTASRIPSHLSRTSKPWPISLVANMLCSV